MMLNIVPVVLRGEIYALAAFLGAITTALAVRYVKAGRAAAMTAGFVVCLTVRLRLGLAGLVPAPPRLSSPGVTPVEPEALPGDGVVG
jgi:hypothetical protein